MQTLEKFLTQAANQWLSVVIILILAWLLRVSGSLLINRIVKRALRKNRMTPMSEDDILKRQRTLTGMLLAIWRWIVNVVAILVLITTFFPEIDFTPLFASAGVIGIAISFGAQSLIKDFLTGVFIITENQYRVGDVVDIEGAAGTVERVGLRSTVLRDTDGNVHYVPNGSIVHVINKTMDFSKVNFSLSVVPDTNISKLANLIDKVGKTMAEEDTWKEKILEAPHFLSVSTMSGSGIDVTIVGKTAPSAQWGVTSEMRKRLLESLHEHHITLAVTPIAYQNQTNKKK